MKHIVFAALFVFLLVACSSNDRGGPKDPFHVDRKRDAFNVPTITVSRTDGVHDPAAADDRIYYEEGKMVAEDRFVQMDLLRRLAEGHLAELIGEAALTKDQEAYAIGVPQSAEKSIELLARDYSEVHRSLVAFSRGVNDYLKVMPSEQALTIRKYRLLTQDSAYLPEPWEPKDSVAIALTMAFLTSSHLKEKVNFGILKHLFENRPFMPKGAFSQFLDFRPIDATFILPGLSPKDPTVMDSAATETLFAGLGNLKIKCGGDNLLLNDCFPRGIYGSNSWVVSDSFTGTGATFLANDTHLPLTYPTTMYPITLRNKPYGTLEVRGVKPPGLLGILIGHNSDIAWGMTNLVADTDDVYIEMFDEAKQVVKFGAKNVPLIEKPYYIKVRYPKGVVVEQPALKVKYVPHHGPVFSEHFKELQESIDLVESANLYLDPKTGMGKRLGLSYKWVGHEGTLEFASVFKLNRAKNYEEFRDALTLFQSGGQNVVYADKNGNVGYFAHGRFPIRKYLSATQPPFVFVEGSNGDREWAGFREEVPELYVPQGSGLGSNPGRLVAANNDPWGDSYQMTPGNYKNYLGYFAPGIRAHRITELLDAKRGALTVDDMKTIQLDKQDGMGKRFVEDILLKAAVGKLSPGAKAIRDQLISWANANYAAGIDNREPVAFYEWMRVMMEKHFADRGFLFSKARKDAKVMWDKLIEGIYVSWTSVETLYHQLNKLAHGDARSQATLAQFVESSLEDAVPKVKAKAHLTWGESNRLKFFEPLEGLIPPSFFFPMERGGSYESVDPAGAGFGANFRLVLVLEKGKPIEGFNILPGGNWKTHEAQAVIDELIRWRKGEYRPLVPFL
jgi:penicillin G amidase